MRFIGCENTFLVWGFWSWTRRIQPFRLASDIGSTTSGVDGADFYPVRCKRPRNQLTTLLPSSLPNESFFKVS